MTTFRPLASPSPSLLRRNHAMLYLDARARVRRSLPPRAARALLDALDRDRGGVVLRRAAASSGVASGGGGGAGSRIFWGSTAFRRPDAASGGVDSVVSAPPPPPRAPPGAFSGATKSANSGPSQADPA